METRDIRMMDMDVDLYTDIYVESSSTFPSSIHMILLKLEF